MSAGIHVRVERLTRRFDRHVALRKVNAELPPGSATLVLGHNGSGKSTLLSILATRLRPTRGTVRYDDVAWEDAGREVRARIGIVAHQPMLYADLTGRENLQFFARLHDLDDATHRIERTLDSVEMGAAADKPVGRCSRGMAQRLALARALLTDPALLLLDEPFTGLDQAASDGLRSLLADARRDTRTVVLVTHRPARVADLCDRVLVLRRGAVAHAGPLTDGGEGIEALLAGAGEFPRAMPPA